MMDDLMQYTCPCCNGRMTFNTSLQKVKCEFCGTEFEMSVLEQYDQGLKMDTPDEMEWNTDVGGDWQEQEQESLISYVCNTCGGEIACEKTTAATSCPFCGNPVVVNGNLSGALRPDVVIPFKLDKEAAKAGLEKHLQGKRLLPKLFKDKNHIDEIKGVYVPFWLFDADADANIRYHATNVRRWSDSDYNYTETSHFMVLRAGNLGFQYVPVDGSSRMPDDLMESIEPFDFSQAVDFQTAYLSGFLADKYDVTAEESIGRANDRIKRSTEEVFASTVTGFMSVIPENSSVRLQNGQAKYALYPVWLLNTTYNGEKYTFAMNGQTGKFVGDLPCDKGAFWRWFGAVGSLAAAASFAVMALFHWL